MVIKTITAKRVPPIAQTIYFAVYIFVRLNPLDAIFLIAPPENSLHTKMLTNTANKVVSTFPENDISNTEIPDKFFKKLKSNPSLTWTDTPESVAVCWLKFSTTSGV